MRSAAYTSRTRALTLAELSSFEYPHDVHHLGGGQHRAGPADRAGRAQGARRLRRRVRDERIRVPLL